MNIYPKIKQSHKVLSNLFIYGNQKRILVFVLLFGMLSSIGFAQAPATTLSGTSIATSMSPGDLNQGMLKFNLVSNKTNGISWTGITVTLTGTAADTDISSVTIWRDDGDGIWNGGSPDTQIGSGTFSGGTAAITVTTQSITKTQSSFYVVYNISSGAATTATAGASIAAIGDITMATGSVNGFPISSADVSLPVELGSWTATSTDGAVELDWMTESEIENQGFIIERASTSSSTEWEEIASFISHPELMGQGSTTQRSLYSFTDNDVQVGETYSYRLADVDYVSNITYHDDVSLTVRDTDESQLPESMNLNDAYPNPFNPLVNLGFKLENSANLELSIYDVQGRLVKTIAQGIHNSGNYTFQWDGMSTQGLPQSSGVYLVRLTSNSDQQIQRITLLR